ncbi:MAG: DNA polymerase I [Actinomycetota bacterium]|nr:DNA polymerase I [Actinomycetota bacterium]
MKLMALDGNSLAYRAFFALPTDMVTANGQVTNSIYGFTSMLLTLLRDHKPDGVVVVFDRKEPTFRHEAAPEYKAQRESQPDILYQQLDLIREMLSKMGVTAIDAAGFEGDDLIATIADRALKAGDDLIIVTGDRDNYQLVSDPHIRVLYNKRGVSDYALYDEAGIFERTGVTPKQYADYAALRGDPSDNLDGVPGVGEKTAAKLINQYKSIEAVFDHADEQTPKLKQSLIESRERVLRNAKLMVLRRDAPVNIDIHALTPTPNMLAVKQVFALFEFKTMFARFVEATKHFAGIDSTTVDSGAAKDNDAESSKSAIVAVTNNCQSVKEAIAALTMNATTDLAGAWLGDPGRSELAGLAVVQDVKSSTVCWIPTNFLKSPEVKKILTGAFKFRGHNVKPLMRSLLKLDIDFGEMVLDTAIAAYLLDPSESRYEIKQVVSRYLDIEFAASDSKTEDGQLNFESPDSVSLASTVAATEALGVALVAQTLVDALASQKLTNLYSEIEHPLVRVLAKMEFLGVAVDKVQLTEINKRLTAECLALTKQLHQVAKQEFNLNSPLQLRKILYEDKKLTPGKKNKTGPSTDAATLEKLKDQWPEFIEPLLEYREVEKLRSTYGEGLLNVVEQDSRIHATFNQTVARTGRLSSDQPNLHNIPVRSEQGKVFRTAFVPRQKCQFLVADYNQIELRCIAHLANDPGLIEAFNKNVDIHNLTASNVFGVATDKVTSEQRSKAKMVSYGLAYGMEAYGLAQRLAIGVSEASEILEAYFAAFPRVKKYMDETVEEARKRGYTETLFGRRRSIPELQNTNFRVRQIGERQAMNSGIQGLAADIFKVALVRLDQALEGDGFESRLVLQVHDEVIVEAVNEEKDKVETLVRKSMGQAAELAVPLEVNLAWGDSWAAAKS